MLHSLLALALCAPLQEPPAATETLLGRLPEGAQLFAAPGESYPARTTVIGEVGPSLAFAPSGDRVAYQVVADDAHAAPVECFVSGPDRRGKLDVDELGAFDFAKRPFFSADGDALAMLACDRKGRHNEGWDLFEWRLVLEGKTYVKEDALGAAAFFPGRTDIACWTWPDSHDLGGGKWPGAVLRVNKKPYDTWESAEQDILVPAGKDLATVVMVDGYTNLLFVRAKGKPEVGPRLDRVPRGAWVFDAQRKAWAGTIRRGTPAPGDTHKGFRETFEALFNGEPVGASYHSVEAPTFAPSSDALAFRVAMSDAWGAWIVGGEEPQLDFGEVRELVWEEGSKGREGLAFLARTDASEDASEAASTWSVHCLNAKGARIEREAPAWLEQRFLLVPPGGVEEGSFVYTARDADGWHLVHEWRADGAVQTRVSAAYDYVDAPVATKTGFAAGALRGDELLWIALD